jgi:hypothetical protein
MKYQQSRPRQRQSAPKGAFEGQTESTGRSLVSQVLDRCSHKTHQMIDTLFNCLAQGESLPLSSDDDNDLPAVKHCGDTDGERHARDCGDVIVKKTSIGKNSVVGESLDTSA